MNAWIEEANKAAAARGLTRPELTNLMPVYLSSLGRAKDDPLGREQRELVESHLSARLRAGFNVDEVLDEFAILQRVLVATLSDVHFEERPSVVELYQLFTELESAMTVVRETFREYLLEDQQFERRYLRLLYGPFAEPKDGDAPLSSARLEKVLAIVMEALAADTAALLLYDPETRELVMTASAGLAREPLARYAQAKAPLSFVGLVAEHERPMALYDVQTTPLEVSATLRHSGIHSLLGIRLPQQHSLLGVIYIGLRDTRAFSAREVRRIEALSERLAFHLDTARLYTELLDQIKALHVERTLREQFVAILAHDLRGPLSAAKMAAELLSRQSPAPTSSPAPSSRSVALILRNLARADRMAADLLDVQQIGAGKRLVLHLEPSDLGVIARDVVDELEAEQPGRFVLRADEGVHGVWDPFELRRALWNLASNALKYGGKDTPITILVAKRPEGVEVSVHNEGSAIPEEVQATLFEPFVRAISAGGARGWGLGLTLVRGCAEAHGGSVHIDSALGRGTTFTLRLPEDARPVQVAT